MNQKNNSTKILTPQNLAEDPPLIIFKFKFQL